MRGRECCPPVFNRPLGSTRSSEDLVERLRRPTGSRVISVRSLAAHTTLQLGGPTGDWFAAESEADLIEAARNASLDLFVLGGGSNVVVADEGFDGLTVQVLSRGIQLDRQRGSVRLRVQAGERWDALVALAVERNLAGIECLSGIPGTVGAVPMQNVSAYGQVAEKVLRSVKMYDRVLDHVIEMPIAKCGLEYRDSLMKRSAGRFVVLGVELELDHQAESKPIAHKEVAKLLGIEKGETAPLPEVRAAVIELRRHKGMVLDPGDPDTASTGSFFMNPFLRATELDELHRRMAARGLIGPEVTGEWATDEDRTKVPAAWLIENSGFSKGQGNPDGVAISTKHALALTNRGRGTTRELVNLAREIAGSVERTWGIGLTPEPIFVGHSWALPS